MSEESAVRIAEALERIASHLSGIVFWEIVIAGILFFIFIMVGVSKN